MTRAQRRAHRVVWALLALVWLVLVVWALRARDLAEERSPSPVVSA